MKSRKQIRIQEVQKAHKHTESINPEEPEVAGNIFLRNVGELLSGRTIQFNIYFSLI
jgi:hypothetical protein